jgi:ornithine cyclodeaminase/alanine dehydrogenase-like protein (mu-crystallin family)
MAAVMHLGEDRIREVLSYPVLIPAMEPALASFSAGQVLQPLRNMMVIEEGRRYLGIMPVVAENAMGAKLVSFFPRNAGTNVPTLMRISKLSRTSGPSTRFASGAGRRSTPNASPSATKRKPWRQNQPCAGRTSL